MSQANECDPDTERLISATAAARKLGVDVDTLLRWHRNHRGPAVARRTNGTELAYRRRDLEAWQNSLGAVSSDN